jgi:formylglycine-generating enzyme required for sulfatase activity
MKKSGVLAVIVCVMAVANFALADTIRGINMDFVSIGNAGNGTDPATGNLYGAVSYNYRIGKYEVTNAQWNAFTAVAGAPIGNPAYWTGAQQPTNEVIWYEAAQFCNYLTSGDKSKGVYQFSGDNTNPGDFLGINRNAAISSYGIAYVLPTEDEWYKAAYFKPNASGYSLYANGTNTAPSHTDACYGQFPDYTGPWNVGSGTQEQNGTFDMMGNVDEWNETLFDSSHRVIRGGSFIYREWVLSSSAHSGYYEYGESYGVGFRIASVPEPATLLLLGFGAVMLRRRR